MAMCPLLKQECIKNGCEWWYHHAFEFQNFDRCAITLLPETKEEILKMTKDIDETLVSFEYDFNLAIESGITVRGEE